MIRRNDGEDGAVQNEVIWAPWRLAYITSASEADQPETADVLPGGDPACFLCRCAAPGDDKRKWVIARGRSTVTVMNCYPYNNGHLLVAPLRHVADITRLSAEEDAEIAAEIKRMVAVLARVLRPEGFNIGVNLGRVAGAGVPGHLHWHIVPRWGGDTNFMATVAGTRVIPQSLEALWNALVAETAAEGQTPQPAE